VTHPKRYPDGTRVKIPNKDERPTRLLSLRVVRPKNSWLRRIPAVEGKPIIIPWAHHGQLGGAGS